MISTQHELSNLFHLFINGMRRLDRCIEYINESVSEEYVPEMFSGQTMKIQQLQEYLQKHSFKIEYHEAKDLISRLGGNNDKLHVKDLRMMLNLGITQKVDAEQLILRLIYEEILLERNADECRIKILKRWDYNCEKLFKCISNGSPSFDAVKIKKFFVRLRQPITDEEILFLLRRIGNGDQVTYFEFQQAMKTQKQRVNDRIEVPIKQPVLKQQASYMDKLRKKYQIPLLSTSKVLNTSQNQQLTPRSTTPKRSLKTEPRIMNRTPTQLHTQQTEPRRYTPNEYKEINSLFSLYLNQQRCLQNVLAQLEDVVYLKSLKQGGWEKEWQQFSVNAAGITYEQFINILKNYDPRGPFPEKITISTLPNGCLSVADNLFDLLRDQYVQLQRVKVQFLRENAITLLDKQFAKGYLDVLDVLQLLEQSSSSQVQLQDAELLIARINGFNGSRTITRKVFLNEMT